MWITWLSEDHWELGNHSYEEKEWIWINEGYGLMDLFIKYKTMNTEDIWFMDKNSKRF